MSAVREVRVLLGGLTLDGTVYQAGDVVTDPSPRLSELAGGEPLHGRIVAEYVAPPAQPEPEPQAMTNRRKR